MPPSPIVMPKAPQPQGRARAVIGIIIIVLFLFILAAGGYFFYPLIRSAMIERPTPVAFFGAATTTWYMLSGNTLSPAPTPISTPAAIPLSGPGRALGRLPDGSVLALTPLGLARVANDGAAFQILHAGGDGSTAPIGAASSDLSLVAFENQTTHEIAVYRFDRTTLSPVFMGIASPVHSDATAIAPAGYGYIGDASSSRRMLIRIDAEGLIPISRFPNGTTKQEQKAWSGRLLEPSSSPSVVPVAAAITANTLLVEWSPGGFSAYAISQENVGPAVPLSIVDNE